MIWIKFKKIVFLLSGILAIGYLMGPISVVESSPLDKFLWERRILLVSTPSKTHPLYLRQLASLSSSSPKMRQRYLMIIECVGNVDVKIDGQIHKELDPTTLRSAYGISKTDYQTLLIGYDGEVKLRDNQPISTHVLFDTIDRMPIRRMEMDLQKKFAH
jgi:hypothetical protein